MSLARVRENQRRSRARRKDYLQELEGRFRQCEMQGIEASAEIQAAARRVAEENKILRALLAQNGITDDAVQECLRSAPATNVLGNGSASAQALELLLGTPKVYCRSESSGVPANSGICPTTEEELSSSSSASTLASRNERRSPVLGQMASHYTSVPNGIIVSPSIAPIVPSSYDAALMLDKSTSHSHDSQEMSYLQMDQPSSRSHVTKANTNSCVLATEMISNMSSRDPIAIRHDLGCKSNTDCEVDNQLVFKVMDRSTRDGPE